MVESLQRRLPQKVSTAPADLETHGRDEGYPAHHPPIAVVYAEGLEDIQATLAWAREHRIPVVPFGAGTSIEGHVIPQGPALSLDLSRMNRVLEVRPEDFLAVVEPGVTRKTLNEALKGTGLFFPVDPGADASLGGMAATNASGTTTVRYGGMRQNVLALQVVLANGEVLELGRGVRKTSAGYDLKDLFIGSEGTLGIITRLTLKLHPIPEHIHTLRVFFENLTDTAQAAYAVMASGLPVARLELVDEIGIKAINRYLGRNYPEKPVLFLEFHSSTRAALEAESRLALELMQEAGAISIDAAHTQEERTAQWEARHQSYWALVNLFPGKEYLSTDTAVPISKMPDLVTYSNRLLRELGLTGNILGHVGDGNFHTLVVCEPGDPRAEEFSLRLVEHTLALGGTCTGEHGVGLRKKKYLPKEHGPALAWMRQIKQLFDPHNLLNPGKIFD
ncbi:FAD-binding oxidoreductase [Meiothermus ruber]|uniref:D-lactate dehydrogenase (cytochrome) n=1 Tax=Meiothermus ruber (strain ATCC 35948 / DSM 1279 / VKM B-1258 / 21) TaxID=504728 RepID=D3PKP2_MEIRD|nr:FAD-linked oxidase C-terminal domain-containing protein [Meiothermus ruber]ADD28916.1 FAD linked oxidase domain protein [Meiothermus ruber DSM 1279]AGK05635.1 FAD linked oxidase domain-containing protein [Meiothermus ruber DSM 1279]MCL6530890.1 FAD-binding protein [Meiothermus ruber]GAO75831.1 FAD linked oxidase domain-containing protein [Meiothermus ruber H328]